MTLKFDHCRADFVFFSYHDQRSAKLTARQKIKSLSEGGNTDEPPYKESSGGSGNGESDEASSSSEDKRSKEDPPSSESDDVIDQDKEVDSDSLSVAPFHLFTHQLREFTPTVCRPSASAIDSCWYLSVSSNILERPFGVEQQSQLYWSCYALSCLQI